ncbi:hypothetical protein BH10ACI3_BH10ACI3_01420 [soil metagenome]
MFVSFEVIRVAAIELMFAGIPESVGLLGFGIGLVVFAVLIRRLIARSENESSDRKISK